MDTILHRLEAHLLRGPSQCHRLLGVSHSSYLAMKAGQNQVPRYVALHAELLLRLPGDLLLAIEKERLA